MIRFKTWQWIVLTFPIALPVTFILVASGYQIHQWGINWIWGIFIFLFVGWRWLLVKWTRPAIANLESVVKEVEREIATKQNIEEEDTVVSRTIDTIFQDILQKSQNDPIIWQDWQLFLTRCQELIVAIAGVYHPEVKRPLLNIYIPQAYGLIRGTVDDMDRWMGKLSPALNQVTIGQAYEAYEIYRKLEPSAQKITRAWNWAQWLLNPAAAIAKQASRGYTSQANQQLLLNFNQLFREAALRNLCGQAIALYSGNTLPPAFITTTSTPSLEKTATLREIIEQAENQDTIAEKPLNILLIGRTGAGKSSLINTLFQTDIAEVDILPSTDKIQSYHWETPETQGITLWDSPGYEQVDREDLKRLVLDYGNNADLLLLVTPVLDPSLQMDVDFLAAIQTENPKRKAIAIVTQVDRLRPIREWNPPYNWQSGEKPKEKSIREAIAYRQENLGEYCDIVLPVVNSDRTLNRDFWGIEELSIALIQQIDPAKQLRLARFLRDQEARIIAAAKIIERYTWQVSTTQGLTALLKSPILQFISTITTGTPSLAYALAAQIPVEQLPIVIGKLQMAYDLFSLLSDNPAISNFDLLSLWPLLLNNENTPEKNTSAFGHALVEYWTKNLTTQELQDRFNHYLLETQ